MSCMALTKLTTYFKLLASDGLNSYLGNSYFGSELLIHFGPLIINYENSGNYIKHQNGMRLRFAGSLDHRIVLNLKIAPSTLLFDTSVRLLEYCSCLRITL